MKNRLILSVVFVLSSLCLGAQNTLETLAERYNKGERKPAFLKEYIAVLESNKMFDQLETVADAYLLTQPVKKRYKGSNLELFLSAVRSPQAKSFRDLIDHWGRCVKADNSKQITNKVCQTYISTLFKNVYEKTKLEPDFIANMRCAVAKLNSEDQLLYGLLLDLRLATEASDFSQINRLTNQIMKRFEPKRYQGWGEMAVISSAITWVVDEGDLEASKALLTILTPYKKEKGRYFINTVCDTLEGKIKMFE